MLFIAAMRRIAPTCTGFIITGAEALASLTGTYWPATCTTLPIPTVNIMALANEDLLSLLIRARNTFCSCGLQNRRML